MRNNAPTTANEPACQNNRAAQTFTSADEALYVGVRVMETSIANVQPAEKSIGFANGNSDKTTQTMRIGYNYLWL